MVLLLSNDDGIDAEGLAVLERCLEPLGTVVVVAPDRERSACGHALTMDRPLRVREVAPRRWSVSGVPADCIYVAVHHLLDERPALVVSGINDGANLGTDVHYSGTVAAAREGCLQGLPAVSISLVRDGGPHNWDTAARVAERVVSRLLAHPPAPSAHINVNVPNIPLEHLRGLRACRLGRRNYAPLVDVRSDPRGRPYVWIGGNHRPFTQPEGTGHSGPKKSSARSSHRVRSHRYSSK